MHVDHQYACKAEDETQGDEHTLHERLDCGNLADQPSVDISYGTGSLPAEQTIRIMLADLDSFADLTPTERAQPFHQARWWNVVDDFRRLRELIG